MDLNVAALGYLAVGGTGAWLFCFVVDTVDLDHTRRLVKDLKTHSILRSALMWRLHNGEPI